MFKKKITSTINKFNIFKPEDQLEVVINKFVDSIFIDNL